MNINNFKLLFKINIIKTIYFNLKYFGFKKGKILPFFIYRHTHLLKTKGKIIIEGNIWRGMVKVGPHHLGTQNFEFPKTMWEVNGTLIIKGDTMIGRGSKISIGSNATLTLGNLFRVTGDTSIICQKEISFGNDCLLSWHILIMDSDLHHILDKNNNIINSPQTIKFGNHVWICARSTILKGVSIPDNTIIAANSLITKVFYESNCIIGGHGNNQQIIKEGIDWKP